MKPENGQELSVVPHNLEEYAIGNLMVVTAEGVTSSFAILFQLKGGAQIAFKFDKDQLLLFCADLTRFIKEEGAKESDGQG